MTDRPKTPRSPEYLAFIRTKACLHCGVAGYTQASHHGKHGTSTKASDFRALPLCGPHPSKLGMVKGCHGVFTDTGRLPGSYMDGEQTLDWAAHRALDLHDEWLTR